MADINNITLTGRLVHDPVLNRSASGQCLGSFVLASNHRYTNRNGETRAEAAFVPCKAYGGWAEALDQHRKGEPVVVSGRLRTEKWEKDGQLQSQLALVCNSVRFLADHRPDPEAPAVGGGIPF
jgi:single-strand DNA-binding protein